MADSVTGSVIDYRRRGDIFAMDIGIYRCEMGHRVTGVARTR